MAFKTKRLLKKIVSWSGLFFFVVAAYMIYHQLSKYKLEDIKDALVSIPAHNLFLACMASLGGYVALSSYDFLALRYIGRKLAPWKWIFAGFIGFPSATTPAMPSFPAAQSVTGSTRAGVSTLPKSSAWSLFPVLPIWSPVSF